MRESPQKNERDEFINSEPCASLQKEYENLTRPKVKGEARDEVAEFKRVWEVVEEQNRLYSARFPDVKTKVTEVA